MYDYFAKIYGKFFIRKLIYFSIMKIKLSKLEIEEFLNKMAILLEEPEMIREYNLSKEDVSILNLVCDNIKAEKIVFVQCPYLEQAIKEEMLDAANILMDQIDDEMKHGEKIAHSRLANSIKKKFK